MKLSHIILYVNDKSISDDIKIFCANVTMGNPECTVNSLHNITEIINYRAKCEETFMLSDDEEAIRAAGTYKIGAAAILSEYAADSDFTGVLYCIEDIAAMDYGMIERMYRRYKHIPWTIAVTDRLVVREQTLDDIDDLYEIYSDPSTYKYTDNLYEDRDKEAAFMRDYIENQYNLYEYGIWAVERRSDGKLIGRAGISDREGVSEPEIGYVIAAGCRRQGYAREALEAIIRYASEELGMDRLAAYTMADNDASAGILKKLGFAKSGEHEISGRMHDKYVLDICGRI